MDITWHEIVETFREQSTEILAEMEAGLIELEQQPDAPELLESVFRGCHTLKGDAASLGFAELSEFAHVFEDVLSGMRSGAVAASAELITLALEALDVLRELTLASLEEGAVVAPAPAALLQRLRDASAVTRDGAGDAPSSAATAHAPASVPERAPTLPVRIETLDRLMSLVGELAVARSQIARSRAVAGGFSEAFAEEDRELDLLIAELQEQVMRVRMVPVGPLLRRHARSVRDVASAQGKQARLELRCEDAELDTTVVDHLQEALGHVIRNAVAHGIELPDERLAAGKVAWGRVAITAHREGSEIVVRVEDDGRGLDLAAIRERARGSGNADAERMSDAELTQLIFQPGFSTADATTLAAGRGVGMDVVRRSIEQVGGSAEVASTPGRGCCVTLRLPLTLAIIHGFAVGVGGEVMIMPLGLVHECLDRPAAQDGERGLLDLRGRPLGCVRLSALLGWKHARRGRESVVVVAHEGEHVGLVVDEILGETQAVIKPLARQLRQLPGLGGATILGDGRVALILDVATLLRRRLRRWRERDTPAAQKPDTRGSARA